MTEFAPYTTFGETRNVKLEVRLNDEIIDSDIWDEVLWIERGEDWYGLMSLKDKKVRIIRIEDWLRAETITTGSTSNDLRKAE